MWEQQANINCLHQAASEGKVNLVYKALLNSFYSESNKNDFDEEVAADTAVNLFDIVNKRNFATEEDEVGEKLTLPIINIVNAFNKTALHLAAENGHLNVVKLLLAANADYDLKDAQNNSAWGLATLNQKREVAALLLAIKAVVEIDNVQERQIYINNSDYNHQASNLVQNELPPQFCNLR